LRSGGLDPDLRGERADECDAIEMFLAGHALVFLAARISEDGIQPFQPIRGRIRVGY